MHIPWCVSQDWEEEPIVNGASIEYKCDLDRRWKIFLREPCAKKLQLDLPLKPCIAFNILYDMYFET